jgi:hypothetical protein
MQTFKWIGYENMEVDIICIKMNIFYLLYRELQT